jgi:biopolymer transport protein ExbB
MMPMRRLVVGAVLAGCNFSSPQAPPAAADAPLVSPDAAIDAQRLQDGTTIPADWWDPAWTHRRLITIDNSSVATPLAAFPVLISLTSAGFDYSDTHDSGADLRFIASDHTTVLAYDVDTFNGGGTSTFWVAVDIHASSSPKPTLWLYYDNAAAAHATNAAAVWSTEVSVHHLTDFTDASGNGHDGAAPSMNTTPTIVGGQIGGARSWDGADDQVLLPVSTAYDFTTSMSVSLWTQVNAFTADMWDCFICKADGAWRVHRGDTTSHADFGTTQSSGTDNLDTTSNVTGGAWHHIAVEYDGTTKSIYFDGALQASQPATTIEVTTDPVDFGENTGSMDTRFLTGLMDEIRISSQTHGAAWFAAEYQTVTDPTFATLGADQALPQ